MGAALFSKFEGGIRSLGRMIPGIWFEFEVASAKAGLYDDPDHFVKKDGAPLTVGGARFWDTKRQIMIRNQR